MAAMHPRRCERSARRCLFHAEREIKPGIRQNGALGGVKTVMLEVFAREPNVTSVGSWERRVSEDLLVQLS